MLHVQNDMEFPDHLFHCKVVWEHKDNFLSKQGLPHVNLFWIDVGHAWREHKAQTERMVEKS